MTGFNSHECVGDGSFEQDFAENMLGAVYILFGSIPFPPQTIFQAWFNAAATAGIGAPPAGHGVPAAMGPITTGDVCDINDYYLGKGTQGPTIVPASVTGWWYATT